MFVLRESEKPQQPTDPHLSAVQMASVMLGFIDDSEVGCGGAVKVMVFQIERCNSRGVNPFFCVSKHDGGVDAPKMKIAPSCNNYKLWDTFN